MKKTNLLTATAIIALMSAGPAFAQSTDMPQDPSSPTPPAVDTMPDSTPPSATPAPEATTPDATAPDTGTSDTQAAAPADMFLDQQASGEILASSLIGANVKNASDETLGSISDIVLSAEGSVEAVVIGVGGFLGIGTKNVAVAYSALNESTDENGNAELVLNASAEELEAAPAYVTVEQERQNTTTPTAPMAPTP